MPEKEESDDQGDDEDTDEDVSGFDFVKGMYQQVMHNNFFFHIWLSFHNYFEKVCLDCGHTLIQSH